VQSGSVEVTWRSIARVLVAIALVYCWLQLASLLLLLAVAIILVVTLDPVVRSLEQRGVPRSGAAGLVVLGLLAAILGFAYLASSSLSEQSRLVGVSMTGAANSVLAQLPEPSLKVLNAESGLAAVQSYLAPAGIRLVQGLASALVVFALAAILTLYLLIEGTATYKWLLAFVPRQHREKVALTADECQRVIRGYVAGNLATSSFAVIFVFIALTVLRVPAALLLAVLAGICDFVPVLGFAVSSVPAIVLALTVSPTVGVAVAGLYLLYHTAENYVIAPWVYGDRLRLSNVAVVLAFAVGAELAGIVGAVIALPIAAAYPAIERIWLKQTLGKDVIREHAEIEKDASTSAVTASDSETGLQGMRT
jgi:predicted PurR-regulated permease PerM